MITMTMITMTKATTITTTDRRPRRRRGPRIGVFVVVVVALAGCNGTADSITTTTAIGAAGTTPTTVATTTSTSAAAVDPTTLLAGALESYGDGYTFTSTATIGGATAIVVSGRQQGANSEMLLTSGDGEIEYLLTADGQWVRTPGGDWQQLDTQQPPAAPLTQLAAPSRLELVRNEAGTVELSATYDGAVFGLASSEVVVLLTFRDGLLTEAGYTSEQEGVEAEVITQFAPAADTTPITAPPAES